MLKYHQNFIIIGFYSINQLGIYIAIIAIDLIIFLFVP